MSNDKRNSKDNDNTGLLIVLGVISLGGVIGAATWAASRSKSKTESSAGVGSLPKTAPSLTELAVALRNEVLIVDGCTVSWRVGEASRTTLLGHRDDFLVPAIADARTRGANTVDEITAHVCALLVPGCAWPPPVLANFDLDKALADELTFVQKQAWTLAQTAGAVKLYLTVRQAVGTLAAVTQQGAA